MIISDLTHFLSVSDSDSVKSFCVCLFYKSVFESMYEQYQESDLWIYNIFYCQTSRTWSSECITMSRQSWYVVVHISLRSCQIQADILTSLIDLIIRLSQIDLICDKTRSTAKWDQKLFLAIVIPDEIDSKSDVIFVIYSWCIIASWSRQFLRFHNRTICICRRVNPDIRCFSGETKIVINWDAFSAIFEFDDQSQSNWTTIFPSMEKYHQLVTFKRNSYLQYENYKICQGFLLTLNYLLIFRDIKKRTKWNDDYLIEISWFYVNSFDHDLDIFDVKEGECEFQQ